MSGGSAPTTTLGYEFAREDQARAAARDLERRFPEDELMGLRIYRVRWNDNFIVEAAFVEDVSEERLRDARALLGEVGTPVHPDDLADYKRATREARKSPSWFRRFFGMD